ncbi:Ig-like domain-containing protein [Aureitalea marina]|uniref:SbsA Ig-like domain-containing protein n=1 Tax=Aureitalea marina TaxID=930804 RepID=A0A2S7KSU1_9FLAO|nr:Ig-like domain-containing protein [Aureitalea marina]PQB05648.1 hypothetical protein BST85_12635 [Aureitalea marina]
MKIRLYHLLAVLAMILAFSNCAKRGSPDGGPRDSIAPVILKTSPENYTIYFDTDEIRVTFDEFIRLEDLQQNLIISPPLEYQPEISPFNTSKTLKVKINDTLKENTTYSINFGQSIVDNNEGNPYLYYKYVFSTGSYIDSLTLSGTVRDALLSELAAQPTLMLYEVTEEFTDSVVYLEKPTYITTLRDTTNLFEFTNLKEGRYLLVALQEEQSNYTFQPDTDKIGFIPQMVNVPSDSLFDLVLFKEELDYEVGRARHVSKYHLQLGFQGDGSDLYLEPMSELPDDFEFKRIRNREYDTIQYWFKPAIDVEQQDTLYFMARKGERSDSIIVRTRDLYADSLVVNSISNRTLIPRDSFKIRANTPIVDLNPDLMEIMAQDSTMIVPEVTLNEEFNEASLVFDKADETAYRVRFYPGAITDFYGETNDTLQYNFRTIALSDYGTLDLNLVGQANYPLVVQLVDESYRVVREARLQSQEPINFDYILPAKYYIRLIEDSNDNGRWDSGNFLKRLLPEKVIYYPELIEVRANWSLNETFILGD